MRKVKIKPINGGVLFPPLKSTLDLLCLPSDMAGFAREVKSRTGMPLPVDNKTLNKITTQGIGRKKVLEVIDYTVAGNPSIVDNLSVSSFFDHDFRRMIAEAKGQPPRNGHFWECFIYQFERSCDIDLPITMAFLKNRIEAEKKAHQGTRDTVWLRRYIHIVSENMLVDRARIEDFFYRCIAKKPEMIQSDKEFLGIAAVDFYFWLLAYIEQDLYGIVTREVILNDDEQTQVEEGVIQHILPQITDQKYAGSLARLFDRWRTILSNKREEPINNYAFAEYMPDPVLTDKKPGEMDKEDLKKSKYRAFCDWKSGKKIPSDDKLERFISELLPECRERIWWFWFAKVAVAMDKLFKKLRASGDFSEAEVVALFQTYKNYQREVRRRDAT